MSLSQFFFVKNLAYSDPFAEIFIASYFCVDIGMVTVMCSVHLCSLSAFQWASEKEVPFSRTKIVSLQRDLCARSYV